MLPLIFHITLSDLWVQSSGLVHTYLAKNIQGGPGTWRSASGNRGRAKATDTGTAFIRVVGRGTDPSRHRRYIVTATARADDA